VLLQLLSSLAVATIADAALHVMLMADLTLTYLMRL
jgi:hypothetical protein